MEGIRPEILRCALQAEEALWLGLGLFQSCRLWRSFITLRALRLVSTWFGFSSLTPCSISSCTSDIFLRWSWGMQEQAKSHEVEGFDRTGVVVACGEGSWCADSDFLAFRTLQSRGENDDCYRAPPTSWNPFPTLIVGIRDK